MYEKEDSLFVTFLYEINNTPCVTFLYTKTIHFALRFISQIYRIVLIPNFKHMYDQIDQTKNKFELFIEN